MILLMIHFVTCQQTIELIKGCKHKRYLQRETFESTKNLITVAYISCSEHVSLSFKMLKCRNVILEPLKYRFLLSKSI